MNFWNFMHEHADYIGWFMLVLVIIVAAGINANDGCTVRCGTSVVSLERHDGGQ